MTLIPTKRTLILFVVSITIYGSLLGQEINDSKQNTSLTLSLSELTSMVIKFHPVAKQADIEIGQAKQDLRISRGAFDPVFSYRVAEKTFDGTAYYFYQQPTLTLPTWFGVTLQTGVEEVTGNRIDPTETVGRSSYMGMQIPLGRDLITDKRRTDLQKAKIAREASYTERRRMINDLLLEAHSAYWEWWQQYRVYMVVTEALNVARKRVDFVRISVKGGDRPALDITEALAQLQLFEVQWNQTLVALRRWF